MSSSKVSLADILSTRDFVKIQEEAQQLAVRKKQEQERERLRQQQEAENLRQNSLITQEDLQQAEKRGYERGFHEGGVKEREKVLKEQEEHLFNLEQRIADHIEISEKYTAVVLRQSVDAMSIILKHLLGDISKRYPQEMFERVIKRSLELCPKEVSLEVFINPTTHIYIADLAKKFIQSNHYVIKEDPSLQKGECVVEWGDKGLLGSIDIIQKDIDAILEGFKQGIHPMKIELPPLDLNDSKEAENASKKPVNDVDLAGDKSDSASAFEENS